MNSLIIPEDRRRDDERFFRNVRANFDKNWNDSCRNIEKLEKIICLYTEKSKRKRGIRKIPDKEWRQISRLIGKSEGRDAIRRAKKEQKRKYNAWYFYTSGEISDETVEELRDEWRRGLRNKRYELVALGNATLYDRMDDIREEGKFDAKKDLAFVRDNESRDWVYMHNIKDIDEIPRVVSKSEGKYFVLFLRKATRRKASTLSDRLAGTGFRRLDQNRDKKIRDKQLRIFFDVFGKRF